MNPVRNLAGKNNKISNGVNPVRNKVYVVYICIKK